MFFAHVLKGLRFGDEGLRFQGLRVRAYSGP